MAFRSYQSSRFLFTNLGNTLSSVWVMSVSWHFLLFDYGDCTNCLPQINKSSGSWKSQESWPQWDPPVEVWFTHYSCDWLVQLASSPIWKWREMPQFGLRSAGRCEMIKLMVDSTPGSLGWVEITSIHQNRWVRMNLSMLLGRPVLCFSWRCALFIAWRRLGSPIWVAESGTARIEQCRSLHVVAHVIKISR